MSILKRTARYTALLALLALAGCDRSATVRAPDASDRGEYGVDVLVGPIVFATENTRFEAVGTGRALRSVTLSADSAGEVTRIGFQAGQFVEAGDVLLVLDDSDERLAVAQAEVALRDARRLLKRYSDARDTGAVLPTTFDSAETAVAAARLTLERAQVALGRRQLIAPFDGYVGISDIEVGDRIETGTPIVSLDDRTALMIRLSVPEALAGALAPGDALEVSRWNAPDAVHTARVVDLDSRIDPDTRSFQIQAEIPNDTDALRPGMSFRARLVIEGREFPLVPEIAVQWGGNGAYVWRAQDGAAERVPAEIVQRRQGEVLIDADLSRGDLIVTEGVQRVRDGVALRFEYVAAAR